MDKLKFFELFAGQYNLVKEYSPNEDAEELYNKAINLTENLANYQTNTDIKDNSLWKVELYDKYVGMFETPIYPVLVNEVPNDWYETNKSLRFFWVRYQQYLSRIKGWPQNVIDTIDLTTNDIMRSLGDPKSDLSFDKRGLVLGYVQSGKTANFTGLINKAFDAGYKLVIVLSGIHNDLRAQTQLRLEEEVVGISSQQDRKQEKLGVSKIRENDSQHLIHTLTTVDYDISTHKIMGSYNLSNNKTLMVVKKNKDVLTSLHSELDKFLKQVNENVPVLIIDDEADQASIDTNEAGEATAINRLIRQVLELFSQKAYVGYTATPFANLLIDSSKKTNNEGLDLYPKDFLIGLPKPKEYCGPDEFFNTSEDADDQRPSLVVYLKEEDINMFTQIKKASHADRFSEVPPQMLEAIKAFLISTTIREMRNQKNAHNSMLIHTSRFKDVQSSIKEEVKKAFDEIVDEVQYNSEGEIVESIAELYKEEFIVKTKQWNEATGSSYSFFEWNEVYEKMKKVVKKINVMEVNGNSNDALEYNLYKEKGLNVIAVGGDKLSRGLTLEGLTISYYFRNTMMYDTLMQMGRWFGYRNGYMDLCRIYTSETIASNFEHLAIAMKELREEFDKMKDSGKSPLEFAIKMLAHPSMTLTNPLKMRTAKESYTIYRKTLQQTRIFGLNEAFYQKNMRATNNLVNTIYDKIYLQPDKKGSTKYHVADGVSVDIILEFLKEYQTKSEDKVNATRITNYIKLVNNKYNELDDWKVAIVEGIANSENPPVNFGKLKLKHTVARGNGQNSMFKHSDRVDVKAIVAAGQEFFYLQERKDKEKMREEMPKERGVLLLYPLNYNVNAFKNIDKDFDTKFNENLVPIGIAISFPDSEMDESKVYQINKTLNV
jgi:Z1 domain